MKILKATTLSQYEYAPLQHAFSSRTFDLALFNAAYTCARNRAWDLLIADQEAYIVVDRTGLDALMDCLFKTSPSQYMPQASARFSAAGELVGSFRAMDIHLNTYQIRGFFSFYAGPTVVSTYKIFS